MKHTREVIEDALRDLEDVTRRHLLERGWNYTSQTPGCYWLWHKKIPDGRDVLVSQDMALSMQEWLENHAPTESPSSVTDEMPSIEEVQTFLHVDETGIKAEAQFGGTAVKAWIAIAVDWFRQVGGKSFVVMQFTDRRDGEAYTFTVQRGGGDSPADALRAEQPKIVHRSVKLAQRLRHFFTWADMPQWIESPQKTLGNRRPLDLIVTEQGYAEVSAVLAQLEDGAHI